MSIMEILDEIKALSFADKLRLIAGLKLASQLNKERTRQKKYADEDELEDNLFFDF